MGQEKLGPLTEQKVIYSDRIKRVRKPYPIDRINLAREIEGSGLPENWSPPIIGGDWRDKSFISVEQLTPNDVQDILDSSGAIYHTMAHGLAREHQQLSMWLFHDHMLTAFYEASTRTRLSLESAFAYLGGMVDSTPEMRQMSSSLKGETLYDNARIMAGYGQVIAQRHPYQGAAAITAYALEQHTKLDGTQAVCINAGDGPGEHPTQALLDIATIFLKKGFKTPDQLKKLKIGMVGDLKNGRTVHSLTKLVALMGGPSQFVFVSPEQLAMPEEIIDHEMLNGQSVIQTESLSSVIDDLDVLYVTRIQKERFEHPEEYDRLKNSYIITPDTLRTAKSDMIIMHPLPRVNEISQKVDKDPRAVYFHQAEMGLYVRMALFCQMLGKPYPNNHM